MASMSDLRCFGDPVMSLAIGKLGKGFSIDDSLSFLTGSGM